MTDQQRFASRGIEAVRAQLAKLPPPEALTLAEQRAQYERAERVFPVPSDVKIEHVRAPEAPGEWIVPPDAHGAVLYLHGGGYVIGSPRSHRHLAAAIAVAARASTLLLDYRLAPEHAFPAAVEDAVAAYRWLLQRGTPSRQIVIGGDSAGGGLTVATMLALQQRGLPLPAGGVCISPWTDLTCSGASYATKAAADPIVRRERVEQLATTYLAGGDARNPLASPLFADLTGLPPLLIQVGSDEVLLDDAVALAERARAVGVDATLEIADRMIHVWHWFLPMLDEAEQAVARIGEFVRKRAT